MIYSFIFNAVMELRATVSVGWIDPVRFTDMYLAGRSKKTFPTYNQAFRKLWCHGNEIGKLVFRWTDMDFAGHLVLLNDCNATVNMFKQASAVMTLLKEAVGLESLSESRVVQNVKKGVMKEARLRAVARGKRVRSVMTIDHVRLLIGKLCKKPTR